MDSYYGQIKLFPYSFSPLHWIYCVGQLVPINQNEALYSLLGLYYGGDGRTTMGIPDLKGRSPIHFGTAPGLTPRDLGEYGGIAEVVLNTHHLPTHRHIINAGMAKAPDTTNEPDVDTFLVSTRGTTAAYYDSPPGSGQVEMAEGMLGSSGANSPQALPTRQPYTAINFCICIDGIYPARP